MLALSLLYSTVKRTVAKVLGSDPSQGRESGSETGTPKKYEFRIMVRIIAVLHWSPRFRFVIIYFEFFYVLSVS